MEADEVGHTANFLFDARHNRAAGCHRFTDGNSTIRKPLRASFAGSLRYACSETLSSRRLLGLRRQRRSPSQCGSKWDSRSERSILHNDMDAVALVFKK